jgi:hypothetical protein
MFTTFGPPASACAPGEARPPSAREKTKTIATAATMAAFIATGAGTDRFRELRRII